MKILMLGWELPPHNSGGLGVACYHLSKALAKHGASIDFILPYSARHSNIDYMDVHAATELTPLHRFGTIGAYGGKGVDTLDLDQVDMRDLQTMRGLQKRYIKYVERFVRKTSSPDVIHAHDWLTIKAG